MFLQKNQEKEISLLMEECFGNLSGDKMSSYILYNVKSDLSKSKKYGIKENAKNVI